MSRVSVFIAVSLDGKIARADGSLDWLEPFNSPDEDYGFAEFASSVDVVVMGRNTYDVVLGFGDWPYPDKRVVVMTHRPITPRHGEEFTAGDLLPVLQHLQADRVYLDGGQAICQGLREGLVTDLTLNVIPTILGPGIPLFDGSLPFSSWSLAKSRTFDSGLVQIHYQIPGHP
ncbi:MAG: dihydrofolate reductase family protein [Fimbriimonadaceae bacterium]|nr:dihydrofolate reductase family protein [Fimbriimonadaceae bacterium]